MAGNPPEGLGDDFFEQILAVQPAYTSSEAAAAAGYGGGEVGSMAPMVLQLGSGDGLRGMGLGMGMAPPLGLNLEQQRQGFLRQERFREEVVDGNNNCHNNNNNGSSSSAISRINVSLPFSLCGCVDWSSLALVAFACHFAFVKGSCPLLPPPPPHSFSFFLSRVGTFNWIGDCLDFSRGLACHLLYV